MYVRPEYDDHLQDGGWSHEFIFEMCNRKGADQWAVEIVRRSGHPCCRPHGDGNWQNWLIYHASGFRRLNFALVDHFLF